MKDFGMTIKDTKPEGVEITELKVFVATDIEEVEVELDDGQRHKEFHFNLVEYDKDEYIQLLQQQVQETQDGLVELVDLLV